EVSFMTRNFLRRRSVAILLTFIVGISFLISGILMVGGNKLISFLFVTEYSFFAGLIKWVAIFVLFYSVISMIYRFGPPLRRKFGLMSPGANLATLVSFT